MDRVPIGATIAASFGNMAPAWRRAGGILGFGVVFQTGLAAVQVLAQDALVLSLGGLVVGLFVGTAVLGALYRAGIGPDHGRGAEFGLGPGGLQWGGLEWRVLGVNILLFIIFFVLAVVAVVVWAIGVGVSVAGDTAAVQALSGAEGAGAQMAAMMRVMAGPAGIVTAAIALPTTCSLLWLGAKLGLFAVTVADTQSFSFGQAWTLTRGAVWALIITSVIIFVAELLIGAGFAAAGGVLDDVSSHATTTGRTWATVVAQGIGAAVNGPLSAGMQVFVYRAKRGGAASVAATFA